MYTEHFLLYVSVKGENFLVIHIPKFRGMPRGAGKFLARPTSPCILFDGENISFDAGLVIYSYVYK